MGYKHLLLNAADIIVPALLRFSPRWPTYYQGRVLWPSRDNWCSCYSTYEVETGAALLKLIEGADTFWDVGAHVGWFSLFAARRARSVVAFEPSPPIFALLLRNVAGKPNIQTVNCGLGSQTQTSTFSTFGSSSSGSFVEEVTLINEKYSEGAPLLKTPVAVHTIDNMVSKLGSIPDVIKIDVEGFEYEVLSGAEHLLEWHSPRLLVEIHPPQLKLSGGSESLLLKLLSKHGYQWNIIHRNPNSLYTIEARCPTRVSE